MAVLTNVRTHVSTGGQEQPRPRSSTVIEIHIPILPPSANDMNEIVVRRGKPRLVHTKAYDNWLTKMGLIVNTQRAGGIVGAYKLMIQAVRPHGRIDCDNIIKPTSDILQLCGVIANDCHCEFVSARWVTQGDGMTVRVERVGIE